MPRQLNRCATVLAIIALTLPSVVRGDGGNLLPLLNAFIASIAKSHPELKADIALLQHGEAIAPGRQLGKSAAMGDYTFRPKTWTELTPGERAALLKHPSLKAFIVSVRNAAIYPAISAANKDAANVPGWYPTEGALPSAIELRAAISPDEMLRSRSVEIPVVAKPTTR